MTASKDNITSQVLTEALPYIRRFHGTTVPFCGTQSRNARVPKKKR